MNKRTKFMFLFWMSVSLWVSAQQNRAKVLLEKVVDVMGDHRAIVVKFDYILENLKENIKQETSGEVAVMGDKYNFNYLGFNRIFDGKQVYTIIPDNEEVIIEPSDSEVKDMLIPSEMLTSYTEGYSYKWDILQKLPDGRAIQYIKLEPVVKDNNIKRILIGVDSKTYDLYTVIQSDKNGTKTTIDIKEFKTDTELPPETFVFDRSFYENKGYFISKTD